MSLPQKAILLNFWNKYEFGSLKMKVLDDNPLKMPDRDTLLKYYTNELMVEFCLTGMGATFKTE